MAAAFLAVAVMVLGGVVLVLKLRSDADVAPVEEQVAQWQAEVRADPEDDWAQAGLGLALLEQDRRAEARAAFERSLQLNPRNWVSLFQMGLLVKAEDPDRADELLQAAADNAPRTSKAAPYIALGDLRFDRDDIEGARRAYRRAVADVPFLIDGRTGLAKALEAQGHPGAALEQYRQAIKFDPSNEELAAAIERLEAQLQATPTGDATEP
jgi:tetratricopeptide (TPR) repeat protein